MRYVVDSSTVFPALVAEPLSAKARALLDDYDHGVHELFAPDLLLTELCNALVVAERRNRISPGDSVPLFQAFVAHPPVLIPTWPDLLPRAHQIAAGSVASVYDSVYVALAEREGCDLITADTKLVANLKGQFPFIVLLS